MKTLKEFKQYAQQLIEAIQETTAEPVNSRGVLHVGNKIFVGVNHGKTPDIDSHTRSIVQNHITKYGHWDEGNGGDAEATRPITGDAQSRGSYDEDLINKKLYTNEKGERFTPYHALTNMFGNVPRSKAERSVARQLTDKSLSLRDAIIKNHTKFFSAPASEADVDRFIKEAGPHFQRMAGKKATTRNVLRFIQRGAKEGWKGNSNPDTGIGNMIRKSQLERENYLLGSESPAGVYFIGSGHIPSMKGTLEQAGTMHNLVGGSHAHL